MCNACDFRYQGKLVANGAWISMVNIITITCFTSSFFFFFFFCWALIDYRRSFFFGGSFWLIFKMMTRGIFNIKIQARGEQESLTTFFKVKIIWKISMKRWRVTPLTKKAPPLFTWKLVKSVIFDFKNAIFDTSSTPEEVFVASKNTLRLICSTPGLLRYFRETATQPFA